MKRTPATSAEPLHRVKQEIRSPIFLRRLTPEDKAAALECVDEYGNFIWALARRFTGSEAEAEAAAREIFIDIWRYMAHEAPRTNDELLRSLIARSRLMKYLQTK